MKKVRERNTIKINPSVIYIRPNKTRYDFCGRILQHGRPDAVAAEGAVRVYVYVNLGECVLLDSFRRVISFQFPETRAGEIVDLR
jgi:hypothetical protein